MEYDADPPSFTQPVRLGDIVSLDVEQLGLNGDGLCRINNYVVFVPGALPGEHVEVEILSAGRKHGRGVLREVLTAAPSRTEPKCAHFGECGGCQLQHLDHQAQLAFKTESIRSRLQHTLEREDVPVLDCIGPADPWGHRNRIALQVTEELGQLVAGLYQRRTRRVIPIVECPVSHPAGFSVATATVDAARRVGIDAWDARTDAGTLRTVLARTNSHGDTAVTVVVRHKNAREIADLAATEIGAVGLSINVNQEDAQRLLGRRHEFVKGDRAIRETIAGVEFRLAPAGWFRNSHFAATTVAETVRRFVDPVPDATIVDLYSGMGFFAFTLASKVERVIAIEENPRALADGHASMQASKIRNVEFRQGRAEELLPGVRERIYAMVVDPPPDGCGRFVLNSITKDVRPERIVYVSQNPETFAEEVAVFTQRGYNLGAVQPIDSGPHTGAFEIVALLEGRIVKGKRRSSIAQARRLLQKVRRTDKDSSPSKDENS